MTLAQQTIDRLKQSNELRVQAGVISMDDTRVKVLEDMLTRVEMELVGVDSLQFSTDEILKGIPAKDQASMDDASAYTLRQLEDFDRTVREVEYADIDYLAWMPVIAPPVGATKHTFFLNDLQGKYKRISGSAMDLPLSHISGEEHSVTIVMGGGAIEWNQQELDSANFANVEMSARKARAIRRAYLENIATLVVFSDNTLVGLDTSDIDEAALADTVDDPNSISTGTGLKYWVNKSGREIVADLTGMRKTISTGTLGRWGGPLVDVQAGSPNSFTLILPLAAYHVLLEKYMHTSAGGTNITVWEYLNTEMGRLATGITRYRVIHDFDSMFNSGTVPGVMMVPNDPEAFAFVRPKDLTPLPVQFRGLSMLIPYYDYFGGLKLIRDKALLKRYNVQAA